MEPNSSALSKLTSTNIVFFMNGILSLLGWNAILTSFSYFAYQYDGYDVYLYFPVPLFTGYAIIGLTFKMISEKYSYKFLITLGIIVTNTFLLILLFISFWVEPHIGFWMSEFCCLILGLSGNLTQLSFFAMLNYLTGTVVSRFTVGTAMSGLSLNIAQILIIAILGSN